VIVVRTYQEGVDGLSRGPMAGCAGNEEPIHREGFVMNNATRRGFLMMAGAGAAAVATPGAIAQPMAGSHAASGPLVAYVGDVGGSEVSVLVGEQEIVFRDADLVAKLVQAAQLSGRD